jgi:hypothetical protein
LLENQVGDRKAVYVKENVKRRVKNLKGNKKKEKG